MVILAPRACLKSHILGLRSKKRKRRTNTIGRSQIQSLVRKSRVTFGYTQILVSDYPHVASSTRRVTNHIFNTALKLAEEYGIKPWIVALLDPSPIERGNKLEKVGEIATPPPYALSPKDKKMFSVPELPANMRARQLRSASPSKSTPRKIATPRKRRTKAQKLAEAEEAASVENGTTASASVEPTPSVASEAPADDVVRVEVDEIVEKVDDVETVHTTVKVKMPSSHPDLPLPDTAEGIIEQAREMVEEGRKLEAAKGKNLKRKVDEVEDAEEAESSAVQQAKKVKIDTAMEATLRRERVKGRALVGIVTALAVG
jgi:hypothetical protein